MLKVASGTITVDTKFARNRDGMYKGAVIVDAIRVKLANDRGHVCGSRIGSLRRS
jgi:hypothetical protein